MDSKILNTDLEVFSYKAYFSQKGTKDNQSLFIQLSDGEYVLPYLSQEGKREKNFLQNYEDNEVNFSFKFPKSWGPKKQLKDFSIKNSFLTLSGQWKQEKGKYKARILYKTSKREFLPNEYEILKKSVESFRVWMKKPLEVVEGMSDVTAVEDRKGELELDGFEILLTAEGQMNLLNKLFPAKDFPKKRKQALEKLLMWFPNDENYSFYAKVELLFLLERKEKYQDAEEGYKKLLQDYKSMKDRSYYVWGEYSYAKTLNFLGKKKESIDLLLRLARDESLSLYRRSWSYSRAANYSAENVDRLAILEESISIKGPAFQSNYEYLLSTLARLKKVDSLKSYLLKLKTEDNEFQSKLLNEMLTYPNWYIKNGEMEAAVTLTECLSVALKDNFSSLELNKKALTEASEKLKKFKALVIVQNDLKELIKKEAFSWWSTTKLEKVQSYSAAKN